MNEGKNSWDKITNLPDEFQTNPDLAENAIKKIKEHEKAATVKKRKPLLISIAASFAVGIIGLSVFLPIYLTSDSGNERLYYSTESITLSPITNISEFVEQNNLDICYFDNSQNNCAYTIEDNILAFINQNTVVIDDYDIAIITTKIVLLKDADFYFTMDYNYLSDSIKINDIIVRYFIPDTEEQICRVSFELNKVIYYLDIDSDYYSIGTVEKYVTLLIG